MLKITFVILHYNNLKDTVNCIESLKKYCDNSNVEIVVVDNGSDKEKVKDIMTNYTRLNYIHFLVLRDNQGFAKGNNAGFKFAKYELNSDVIILSNNDIVYYQDDFIDKLVDNYQMFNFDIAGPKIIRVEDQLIQNPTPKIYNNSADVLKRMIKFLILYVASFLQLDVAIRKFLGNSIDTEVYKVNKNDDYQLHGACLIFGKNYINKYEGLYDKTFMYGEESILKYIAERDHLKMMYLDDMELAHYEGATVSSVYGKGVAKRRFFYRWNFKGCLELFKLMSKGNRNK